MNNPINLPGISNITISGRIASGATTLAHHVADALGWEILDGGKLFRHFMKTKGIPVAKTLSRDDSFDLEYEENIKNILKNKKHQVIQSHLAGFDAQAIPGVYKILLICEDTDGNDKTDIRIDRLSNRDKVSIDQAKLEVGERESQNLKKWRRLYAENDEKWVYWDKNFYDLVINTYSNNESESLQIVLNSVGYIKKS
jgi:CMP/dCMP kinase